MKKIAKKPPVKVAKKAAKKAPRPPKLPKPKDIYI